MFTVSAVASLLFLGGWNTGIGPIDSALVSMRAASIGTDHFVLGSYFANLIGMVVLVGKGSLLVLVQIWVRWTLPRLRIDQVMVTCLKYLITLSCFLFLVAVLWPVILLQATGRPTLGRPLEGIQRAAQQPAVVSESGAAQNFKTGEGWLGSERSLRSAAPSATQRVGQVLSASHPRGGEGTP